MTKPGFIRPFPRFPCSSKSRTGARPPSGPPRLGPGDALGHFPVQSGAHLGAELSLLRLVHTGPAEPRPAGMSAHAYVRPLRSEHARTHAEALIQIQNRWRVCGTRSAGRLQQSWTLTGRGQRLADSPSPPADGVLCPACRRWWRRCHAPPPPAADGWCCPRRRNLGPVVSCPAGGHVGRPGATPGLTRG